MAVKPTPAQPWIVNDDGSVDVLVYEGRTFRAAITHAGLTDPSGYQCRIGFAATPGGELLASGSTEDGAITLEALPADAGTLITVTVSDEEMESVEVAKGRWDLVLEAPGGAEDPVCVGAFYTWRRVTP